jgi:hypothetical protein
MAANTTQRRDGVLSLDDGHSPGNGEGSETKNESSIKTRANRKAVSCCSSCEWSSPRFDLSGLWCDAISIVVSSGWLCSSYVKRKSKAPAMGKKSEMKFRKKPVVIEAVQWTATKASFDAILAMGEIPWKPGEMGSETFIVTTFIVTTLEGDHLVRKGDWVIRGVKGEFYPCKPDIFAATYEPVEDKANAPTTGDK